MLVLNNSSRLMRIWPLPQTRSLEGESNFSTVDETDYGHDHYEEASLRPGCQTALTNYARILTTFADWHQWQRRSAVAYGIP